MDVEALTNAFVRLTGLYIYGLSNPVVEDPKNYGFLKELMQQHEAAIRARLEKHTLYDLIIENLVPGSELIDSRLKLCLLAETLRDIPDMDRTNRMMFIRGHNKCGAFGSGKLGESRIIYAYCLHKDKPLACDWDTIEFQPVFCKDNWLIVPVLQIDKREVEEYKKGRYAIIRI